MAALAAIASLAAAGVQAAGTLAAGRASAKSALAGGRAAMASAKAEANMTRLQSGWQAVGAINQGTQSLMMAEAEAKGLLDTIPLLRLRSETEGLAAEGEGRELDIQAKEELAQGSLAMLEARRRKNLAMATLTTRAAASGFMATDPTALKIADDMARYGAVQEGMELYGGMSRSEALRSAAAARRYTGRSAQLASMMEAGAAGSAASSMLDAGLFSAKTSSEMAGSITGMGDIAARNALTAGRTALSSSRATASAAKTAAAYSAAGTLLGGVSSMAAKYG